MDVDRLCAIATKAIGTVLRYHSDVDITQDGGLPILVGQAIRDLYHLRDMAHVQDTRVADLEIACDAALSVAEAYNRTPRRQTEINLRWFYICVQGLLIIDIKPDLLLDGQVPRLPPQQPRPQPRPSQYATGDGHFSPAGSSPTVASGSSLSSPSSPKRSEPSSSSDDSGSSGGSAKRVCMPKANWEDDEIRLMVELKASGMRHSDIATRLGRGLGSVENKYGRIMHQDKWKDYLAQVEAKFQKKRKRSS